MKIDPKTVRNMDIRHEMGSAWADRYATVTLELHVTQAEAMKLFDAFKKSADPRLGQKMAAVSCPNCKGTGDHVEHHPWGNTTAPEVLTCPDCLGTGSGPSELQQAARELKEGKPL